MAHINELMGAGVPARLARMLGSNRLQVVMAGGSSVDDATQLAINFALLATTGPGQGVALDYATGAAATALFNTGPDQVLIYPAPGDAFNNQAADLPVALDPGATFLGVPAVDAWLVVIGGNLADAPQTGQVYGRRNGVWVPLPITTDAPSDGGMYGRQNGMWIPIPPPGPPVTLTISAGGTTAVAAGTTRVYVEAGALVTVILPGNDCLVADRAPQAANYPITIQAPGTATINGNLSFVLVNNWAIARFIFDGSNFGVG